MKKQEYISWEMINQEEYKEKMAVYIEKMNDYQKKIFKNFLNYIKNAGGVQEKVLLLLLEEPVSNEQQERIMLSFLRENAEAEWFEMAYVISKKNTDTSGKECMWNELYRTYQRDIPAKEVTEYIENCENAFEMMMERRRFSEENRENRDEMMSQLETVNNMAANISEQLKECEDMKEKVIQKMASSGQTESQNKEIVLEHQKCMEELSKTRSELKFYKEKFSISEQKNSLLQKNLMDIRIKNHELCSELDRQKDTLQKNRDKNSQENEHIVQLVLECLEQIKSDNRELIESVNNLKKLEKEKLAENSVQVCADYSDDREKEFTYSGEESNSFNEISQGIPIESSVDDREDNIFWEADRGEIQFISLEEDGEDEEQHEFGEVEKNKRVNFFVDLLRKMDFRRFRKLESKVQISELMELINSKHCSKEEKKEFMKIIMDEGADYEKIYQYVKDNREKELIVNNNT